MPPGNGDSPRIRPSHLQAVPDSSSTPEPVQPPETTTPANAAAPELTLPPRQYGSPTLRSLHEGRTPTETLAPNYYQSLTRYLGQLANPNAMGGYEFQLVSGKVHYRLQQTGPGAPVEVAALQDQAGNLVELLKMSYLPDGSVQSDLHREPHPVLVDGPETFHHGTLQGLFARRGTALVWGVELYERLFPALEGLEGRFQPELQATRYDRFAVDRGNIFSFNIQHHPGPQELAKNPHYPRIQLFSETPAGSSPTHVFSLSPRGELNFDPNHPLLEVLSDSQRELARRLTLSIESALKNPQAYQITLSRALQRLGGTTAEIPRINPSIRIGKNAGIAYGQLGEPILTIKDGWDLFRNFHPFAAHRWQNPANPEEVRNLKPTLALSATMGKELIRWMTGGPLHFLFRSPMEPRQKEGNYLRLHLFPKGGGEVTLYRNGELYDIHRNSRGKTWKASEEVTRLQLDGRSFESRFQALQAAVDQRNSGASSDESLRVQRAPVFDLDRFFLNDHGVAHPIPDTETAWRLLQKQIPAGIAADVYTEPNLFLKTNSVQVNFFGSEPALLLQIRQSSARGANGHAVPRVVVYLERGSDQHTRVFEDGKLVPQHSADVRPSTAPAARPQGAYRFIRPVLSAGHFYGIRRVGWAFADGLPYAVGHYLSQYAVHAFEERYYNAAERRLLGTPAPDYSWNYFSNHVLGPYAKLAFFAGLGSLFVDGAYNSFFSRIGRNWSSLPPTWFNSNPIARPIRSNFGWRVVQRGIPLIAGLAGPEFFSTWTINGPQFLRNLKYVGVASATSTGLTLLATRLRPLARGAVRMGLMETAGVGIRGARFTTTLRGGLLLAALEFTIMGILQSRDRRELMGQYRSALQSSVGQAVDRRNELLTQLERGVEIPPAELIEADQSLRQAQAAYRRFLELDERTRGTGTFQTLGTENDFEDVYASQDGEQTLLATSEGSVATSLTAASLQLNRERRLQELRERRERMHAELSALHAQYGISTGETNREAMNLQEFVRRLAAEGSNDAPGSGVESHLSGSAVSSPISVDSPEGQAILEQFRWKAARDTSFVLWSPERRAAYLLRQFRGYRVRETDGSYRPWNQGDALAFLAAVEEANARRVANLEEPLTLPREQDGFNTQPLQRLLNAEQAIRDREMAGHTHARHHAGRLADNVEDFDRQMENYYQRTNERTLHALEGFLESPALAAAEPPQDLDEQTL